MRKPLIAANWKMHKTNSEAVKFINELKEIIKDVNDVQVLICAPFTAIGDIAKNMDIGGNLWVGAQDVFYEEQGAYTGEISCEMLTSLGCCFAIVGHSERRNYFKEKNDSVNKKIKTCLKHQITPILCVGENLEVRNAGNQKNHIENQLKHCLEGIKEITKIVIAYEPIWAISGGDPTHKAATSDDAQKMHSFIRKKISEMYSEEEANNTRIIYGGSMKPENVKELMSQSDIDGGLVGGASLSVEKLRKVIRYKID